MIHIFDVALAHFDISDGRAFAVKGIVRLGKVNEEKLRACLQAFRALDPVQEFEAEPEMIVATRTDKWAVRSDLRRLILYDLHKVHLPGMVCSVEELLKEVNEKAQAERRAHLQEAQASSAPVEETAGEQALFAAETERDEMDDRDPEPTEVGGGVPTRMILLLAAAFLLLTTSVLLYEAETSTVESGFKPIEAKAEVAALVKQVAGVYMTGNKPGEHGIVVQQDGALKLFQLNGSAAPSFVNDSYGLWRKAGYIWLGTHQPAGFVRVLDKDTLEYCSEHYKRVQ